MKFSLPDIFVFLIYCAIVIGVGIIISRRVNKKKDSNSYFFAGNSLPWYLVGSSVIAANISAEQFVGMSGSGFAMGLTRRRRIKNHRQYRCYTGYIFGFRWIDNNIPGS